MSNWKSVLAHFVVDVEDHFDQLKYRLGERFGANDPIMIRPYRGIGSQEKLYLKGRVLENEGVTPPEDNDSLWENLVNMYRRFESDEIPHARILARFQGDEQEVTADEEGYFEVWFRPTQPLAEDQLWQHIELELVEPRREGQPPAKAEGEVFIPPPSAQFGVISDIDDTVLQTDAAHLLHMARTVFLGNARTRLPFKGVGAFYRALFKGAHGSDKPGNGGSFSFNPLFYVSSSPWNLYGLLSEFFHLQDIPIGPILFLRDWGISEEELLPTGHHSHKLKMIQNIMDVYSKLPFILIGDSGQEDPEIYAEVVQKYPQRILAIYIRNVSHELKRPEAIRKLAKKLAETGSTLILANDTIPMAEHAAAQGWIDPASLPEIREEKKADEAPPGPVEKLLGEQEKAEAPTVVVQAESPEEAKAEVEAGVIEQALEESKEEGEKPTTVVVEGNKEQGRRGAEVQGSRGIGE
jgi:phosphatidate phosphatase APP1